MLYACESAGHVSVRMKDCGMPTWTLSASCQQQGANNGINNCHVLDVELNVAGAACSADGFLEVVIIVSLAVNRLYLSATKMVRMILTHSQCPPRYADKQAQVSGYNYISADPFLLIPS
jgi:hypothetical protein